MSNEGLAKLKDAAQFENTPAGWAKRWETEVKASKESVKEWHATGKDVVRRFLDRREAAQKNLSKVNLFTSNTQTTRAFLYGKVPQVDVKRRWGDPNDKASRAAGEAMQRLLNTDIERDTDTFTRSLKYALSDRLLPGSGWVKLRYVLSTKRTKVDPRYKVDDLGQTIIDAMGNKQVLADGYEKEEKDFEDVEIDFYHWDDVLWSAGARTWEEVRWIAFKAPLTREGLYARFLEIFKLVYKDSEDPEKAAKARLDNVPLNSESNKYDQSNSIMQADPWARADVWEIWDKEHLKVWWYVEGFDEILDDKPDPMGLAGFWPCPMPLMANLTPDAFMPRPDFVIAQDLYNEIDEVTTRIKVIQQGIIVRGVYNGNLKGISRLLQEAAQNELIPLEDWPGFTEQGGLKGNIEWMPIEQLVSALTVLRDYRKELIALSQQVTGMSDILRGEATDRATATEQAIKAKFASIRLQDFQDEFARFASDVQRIKAEIIVKFYDDKTIIDRSNILYTADRQFATAQLDPATGKPAVPFIAVLRSKLMWYKIQIKPESVSSTDYTAMQQERTQVMAALTQFLQVLVPIGEKAPELVPELLQVAGWMFTSFRGGNTVEGIFDQLVQKAEGLAQAAIKARSMPPPPDPKTQAQIQVAQIKGQAEGAKAQLDVQGKVMEHQQAVKEMKMENDQTVLEHAASMAKVEGDIRKEGIKIAEKMAPEGAAKRE